MTLQPAATGTLPTNGASVNFGTSTPGQTAYINFTATAGQTLSLALTSLVDSPSSVNSVAVKIANPDGTSFTSTTCGTSSPGCEIRLQSLPQTGTYLITVTPNGQASTTFAATLSSDVSGTLTIGTPVSIDLAAVGQSATLTFTISSQQTVAVAMNSLSLSPANSVLFLNVLQQNGSSVPGGGGSTSTGMAENITNLAPGTYTVRVVPQYPVTGTVQLEVVSGAGGAISPVTSGAGASFSTAVPGQIAYFSFSANAGDNDSIAITGLSFSPSSVTYVSIQLYGPSNQYLTSTNCYASSGGCELHLRSLPQTGIYTLSVAPSGQATMNLTVTLSADLTGTLTSGNALTLDFPAPGQSATLNFTLSSAQTVALNLGALSLSPSSTTVYAYVYNSSGAQVASQGSSSGETINLPNLAAGTYTVVITDGSSYAATGSLHVTLEPGVGGALSSTTSGNGGSFSTSAPGQNAYFTFSANAGDSDSIALTGVTFLPTSVTLGHPVCLRPERPIHYLYKLLLILGRLRDTSPKSRANRHLFCHREPGRAGHDELHGNSVAGHQW